MKQKKKTGKIGAVLAAALLILVLFWVAAGFYRALPPSYAQQTVVSSVMEESLAADGWLIREETVLSGSEGILQLAFREGEKVGKGQTVATVYRDDGARDLQERLSAALAKETQLTYALSLGGNDGGLSLRLDGEIVSGIENVRNSLADGMVTASGDATVASLRNLVLRRDFETGGDAAAELETVEGEIRSLRTELAAHSVAVTAPVSGIYSAVADGYEEKLTPETMEQLKPSVLDSLLPDDAVSDLGKIITASEWYYAVACDGETAAQFKTGDAITLRFFGRKKEDVPAKVAFISTEEDGRRTVIFSANVYLSDFSQERQIPAEVIFRAFEGLRIPQKALRVDENGVSGVYCRVGPIVRFKPAEVICTDRDDCLVRAAKTENETLRLREGDTVVTSAGELYDGMVME